MMRPRMAESLLQVENLRAGFEINGEINRTDFGLTWNAVTEAGGIVVSDAVKIHSHVELIKQAA